MSVHSFLALTDEGLLLYKNVSTYMIPLVQSGFADHTTLGTAIKLIHSDSHYPGTMHYGDLRTRKTKQPRFTKKKPTR